jgi:CubicO group peptidase (beta-lactamase class C family)
MQHSYGRRDDALAAGERLASGYGNVTPGTESFALLDDLDSDTGWLAPEQQPDNAFIRPAGLVWSTASDQARLLGFLRDGDAAVLSDASRRSMLAPHPSVQPHDERTGYDYGLFVGSGWQDLEGQYYAEPVVVHGGNTQTMTSGSILRPEPRLAVSVLANGAEEDLDPLLASILVIAGRGRMPEPSAPPESPPRATDLAAYAGEFTEPNLGNVRLSWQDEELQISVPALDALEVPYQLALVPAALDVFAWSVAGMPMQLSFYDGLDGGAHAYAIGDEIALTRVPLDVKP